MISLILIISTHQFLLRCYICLCVCVYVCVCLSMSNVILDVMSMSKKPTDPMICVCVVCLNIANERDI